MHPTVHSSTIYDFLLKPYTWAKQNIHVGHLWLMGCQLDPSPVYILQWGERKPIRTRRIKGGEVN